MSISSLPTPPSRNDPVNFADRGDNFLMALPTFVQEVNATADTITTQSGAVATAYADTIIKHDNVVSKSATVDTKYTEVLSQSASVLTMDKRYLGVKASAPTLDNQGLALVTGATYYNSSVSTMYVYSGTAWQPSGATINSTTTRQVYTATSGQTTFVVSSSFDSGLVDVYKNGIKLVTGVQVNVTTPPNVVLTTGATLGDTIEVVAFGTFLPNNMLAKAGGTMTGALAQANGTQLLPSYTFSGSTSTGIWSSASGNLDFSTNGANRINISSSGVVTITNTINYAANASIASAATTTLSGVSSNRITVTGNTTITSFGTAPAGAVRTLTFSGALTLTHNATSLILPGAANISTKVGDTAEVESLGSGNWKCIVYTRASGRALFSSLDTELVASPTKQAVSGESYALVYNPNQILYSEDLTNGIWAGWQISAITPNAAVAPNNTTTADKLVENSTSNTHNISQIASIVSGSTYTWSAFIKAAERTKAVLSLNSNNGGFANTEVIVDLTNGSTTAIGSPISCGAIDVGNSWYRVYVTGTAIATISNGVPSVGIYTTSTTYLGNGTSGIYVWGAQFELGTVMSAYSPTTSVASLGQASATNLIVYSEQAENAIWGKTNSSVSGGSINAVVAPDGTITADKLVEAAGGALNHVTQQAISFTSGVYTMSAYVKAAGRSEVVLIMWDGANNHGITFNLTANTTATIYGTIVSSSMQYIGNGWYRVSVTGNCNTYAGGVAAIHIASANSITYAGDGSSGLYVWGVQVETGYLATSYIPTLSTTVTRAAGVKYPQRIILPLNPSLNSRVIVYNSTLNNNVVDPNGSTIHRMAGPMELDSAETEYIFDYVNSTWRVS